MGILGSALDTVSQGLSNIISGGDWRTSGAERALMQYNADEAEKARVFSAEEAEKTRIYNAEQAQLQRDFEERMSNSAYQRAVDDLSKSGLNPYLAYNNTGASTPSGAYASAPTAQSTSAYYGGTNRYRVKPITSELLDAINSAFKVGSAVTSMALDKINLDFARKRYSSTKYDFYR